MPSNPSAKTSGRLSERERLFISTYTSTYNVRDTARVMGISRAFAREISVRPRVVKAIKAIEKERGTRSLVDEQYVLEGLRDVFEAAMEHKEAPGALMAMARSLELMGKQLGMFGGSGNQSGNGQDFDREKLLGLARESSRRKADPEMIRILNASVVG